MSLGIIWGLLGSSWIRLGILGDTLFAFSWSLGDFFAVFHVFFAIFAIFAVFGTPLGFAGDCMGTPGFQSDSVGSRRGYSLLP